MKWFANGNVQLGWYYLSYSQFTRGALMMLILAVCKVLVTFEPPIHLRLPISYLQPSGRASEREIRRCGVRLFQFVSGSFQNENKILYFLLIFFLFYIFYSLHIPTAQLSAWWRIKWCWSIGERLKQEQAQWRILLYQLIGRNSVLDT